MSRNVTWAECGFWGCGGDMEIKGNKAVLIVNSTYDNCYALAVCQTPMTSADQEVSVIWSWTGTPAIYPADWYVWLQARRNTAVCGGYEAGYDFYEARVIREYNGPGDRAQLLKRLGASMTVLANITYTVASGSEVKLKVQGNHLMLIDDGGLAADAYDSDIAGGDYVAFGLAWWDENYSGNHSDMVVMADDFCANNL